MTEFILENGAKFVVQQILIFKHELNLLKFITNDSENKKNLSEMKISIYNDIKIIEEKIEMLEKLLGLPKIEAKEQNDVVLYGNGVKLVLNQKEIFVVIDGVCVAKHKLPKNYFIISTFSPLGQALICKKAGEEGNYTAGNNKINFIIKEIYLPSKVKKIFKNEIPPTM